MNRTKSTIVFLIKSGAPSQAVILLLVVFVLVTGNAGSAFAQRPDQRAFASAEAAANALFVAVQSHDEAAVMDILGANELISAGDDVQDKLEHEQFVKKFQEMHRLVREPDNTIVLYLGPENWPFPISLTSSGGVWRFDSQAGVNEVLCRQIGENEARVIGDFRLLVLAEEEYQRRTQGSAPEYTTRFVATAGTQNGLHWKGDSPIPVTLAKAGVDDEATAVKSAVPFHGYYFRVLTSQGKHAPGGAKNYIANGRMTGGFAFMAYPAEYRSSGVKTFIGDSNGNVYEKNLGQDTAKIAGGMSVYDPDSSWHAAEQYGEEFQ